jgi:hypothetical protein
LIDGFPFDKTTPGRGSAPRAGADDAPGGFVMQPGGTKDLSTGATYGSGGRVLHDPQTGATSPAGGAARPAPLGVDAGGVIVPVRRMQR